MLFEKGNHSCAYHLAKFSEVVGLNGGIISTFLNSPSNISKCDIVTLVIFNYPSLTAHVICSDAVVRRLPTGDSNVGQKRDWILNYNTIK